MCISTCHNNKLVLVLSKTTKSNIFFLIIKGWILFTRSFEKRGKKIKIHAEVFWSLSAEYYLLQALEREK